MNYDYFIGMVKTHESKNIRAFRGQRYTNPEQVPDAFALLMPEIIAILDNNIARICGDDQGMVIFGLQPASSMISSSKPANLNRQILGLQSDYHFCCTLDYLTVPMEKLSQVKNWDHTHSIIIDFTSGHIMDADRFYTQLFNKPEMGTHYGSMSEEALKIAWTIVNIKQSKKEQARKSSFIHSQLTQPFPVASVV